MTSEPSEDYYTGYVDHRKEATELCIRLLDQCENQELIHRRVRSRVQPLMALRLAEDREAFDFVAGFLEIPAEAARWSKVATLIGEIHLASRAAAVFQLAGSQAVEIPDRHIDYFVRWCKQTPRVGIWIQRPLATRKIAKLLAKDSYFKRSILAEEHPAVSARGNLGKGRRGQKQPSEKTGKKTAEVRAKRKQRSKRPKPPPEVILSPKDRNFQQLEVPTIVSPESKAAATRGQVLTGRITLSQYQVLIERGYDGDTIKKWTAYRANQTIERGSRSSPPLNSAWASLVSRSATAKPASPMTKCPMCGDTVAERNIAKHIAKRCPMRGE